MVFYRERDHERPPLSRILPHLYLGAETDVTQDSLSAQGISYVLSVSRCCPQPTFLPQSHYLRIPIDDSLRDDLLPWIPQALRFIDGAMSLGCSVLVHCAAGISRSPALAVAYVMYRLGMDLDHAYRFVKERRPTISPNFNFLGQLQLFQGTLPLKSNNTNQLTQQPMKSLDTCLQSTSEQLSCSTAVPLLANHNANIQDNSHVAKGYTEDTKANVHCENSGYSNIQIEQPQTQKPHRDTPRKSELTLSLSDKLKTLTLSLNSVDVPQTAEVTKSQEQQDSPKLTVQKPTQLQLSSGPLSPLQIPCGSQSLSEKRKSLTLSLTPVAAGPQTHMKGVTESVCSLVQSMGSSSKTIQKGETETTSKTKVRSRKLSTGESKMDKKEAHASRGKEAVRRRSSSRSQRRGNKQNHGVQAHCHRGVEEEHPKPKTPQTVQNSPSTPKSVRQTQCTKRSTSFHQQVAPEREVSANAVEAVEGVDGDQSPLSPINLTVNKLLGWGEKMLLGVLLGPRIKVGQPALSYSC